MHTFTYHAVGQGLFFHSTFKLEEQTYHLVYDCGTMICDENLLIEAIEGLERSTNTIDLLVISHLDYDHISGVKELLNRCTVKKILLPYLSDEEILMIVGSSYNYIPEEEEWYFSFINNPFSFFKQFPDIEEITIVEGKKETDQEEKKIKGKNNPSSKTDNFNNTFYESDADTNILISTFDEDEIYFVGKYLKLNFYNYPISTQKRRIFLQEVENHLRRTGITERHNFYDYIFGGFDRIKTFKEYYTQLSTNHNNVSLLMSYEYHPIPIKKMDFELKSQSHRDNLLPLEYDTKRMQTYEITHLLTGDISLNYKHKHKNIYEHYKTQLEKVDFIQVPHHGAKNNWNKDLLAKIPEFTNFITSSGNVYSHPHLEVVQSIEKQHQLFEADNQTRVVFVNDGIT